MRKITTTLTAAVVAASLAACGSSGSSPSRTATVSSSASSAASRAQTSSGALANRAQHLIGQLASASGKLGSGNSTIEQQARTTLGQLSTSLTQLPQTSAQRLSSTDPSRPIIVQSTKRAAEAARALSSAGASITGQQTMRQIQSSLSTLSKAMGQLGAGLYPKSAAKVAQTLADLGHRLSAATS